ncbi:MAG: hydrogenase [Moorellales bacterium]
MLDTLVTPSGFWNPILWLVALALALAVTLVLRRLGRADYRRGTEQTKPFLSGQPEGEKEHLRAGNIYWGFLEALKGYYRPLQAGHTGMVSDYMAWLVATLVVVSVVLLWR